MATANGSVLSGTAEPLVKNSSERPIYHDPLIAAESAVQQTLLAGEDKELSRTEPSEAKPDQQFQVGTDGGISLRLRVSRSPVQLFKHWLETQVSRLQPDWTFLIRTAVVTALLVVIGLGAFLLFRAHRPAPPLSALDLLNRSVVAEETNAARVDQVLHRTINLEERQIDCGLPIADCRFSATGKLLARRKIEVWQSAERGITARRLFDERGQLIAGDWRRADGVQTLYHHGARPQLQIRNPQSAIRNFDAVWQLEPSAKEFLSLVGANQTRLEDRPRDYVITLESQVPAHSASCSVTSAVTVLKATLTVSKADLHPTEETLLIQEGDETREYHFTEASYERHAPSTVAPAVFDPDPVLMSPDTGTRRTGDTEKLSASPRLPITASSIVATAELEVEVLRLLNQVGADYGEQISVTRTSQGLLHVEGVIDSDKRKREILAALAPVKSNPAVKIEVQTVEEALGRRPRSQPPSSPIETDSGPAAIDTIPADPELRSYFKRQGIPSAQIEEEERLFANRTLARSLRAIQHAWAIKRLTNRFSEEQLRNLDPEARANWLTMIRSHARAVKQEVAMLRQGLTPIFPAADVKSTSDKINLDDDKALSIVAERLLAFCSSNDEVLRAALTISSDTSGASALKSASFWRALNDAQSLATKLESLQNRER